MKRIRAGAVSQVENVSMDYSDWQIELKARKSRNQQEKGRKHKKKRKKKKRRKEKKENKK